MFSHLGFDSAIQPVYGNANSVEFVDIEFPKCEFEMSSKSALAIEVYCGKARIGH